MIDIKLVHEGFHVLLLQCVCRVQRRGVLEREREREREREKE